MHRIYLAFGLCGLLFTGLTNRLSGQQNETDELAAYRQAGLNGGDPKRGKALFESESVVARSAMPSRATSVARDQT